MVNVITLKPSAAAKALVEKSIPIRYHEGKGTPLSEIQGAGVRFALWGEGRRMPTIS